MQPKTFGQFLMGIFSEPDGNPSFSRLVSFLAFLFILAVHAAQFVKTGQVPAGMDFLLEMLGASGPYALNRVGRAFTKPVGSGQSAVGSVPADGEAK